MKGVLYYELLENGQTLIGERCSRQLKKLNTFDYHLFRRMQQALMDSCFQTLDDVRKFVNGFIASKSASFLRDGIRMLPDQ